MGLENLDMPGSANWIACPEQAQSCVLSHYEIHFGSVFHSCKEYTKLSRVEVLGTFI